MQGRLFYFPEPSTPDKLEVYYSIRLCETVLKKPTMWVSLHAGIFKLAYLNTEAGPRD